MITYQQEFLSECLDEFKPMLEKHWEEIALHKDSISLDPDYDRYYELEKEGVLKVFTARDDGKPAGYCLFFINNHIHYKTTVWAKMDIMFLLKEYRNARVGMRLIKFCEECLQEDGVDVIMLGTKSHKPFNRLLEYLGYSEIETTYGKKL